MSILELLHAWCLYQMKSSVCSRLKSCHLFLLQGWGLGRVEIYLGICVMLHLGRRTTTRNVGTWRYLEASMLAPSLDDEWRNSGKGLTPKNHQTQTIFLYQMKLFSLNDIVGQYETIINWPMFKCSLNFSISDIRAWVLLSSSSACGVDLAHPRWSSWMIWYAEGSKYLRYSAWLPPPGPPCRTTTGLPDAFPLASQ